MNSVSRSRSKDKVNTADSVGLLFENTSTFHDHSKKLSQPTRLNKSKCFSLKDIRDNIKELGDKSYIENFTQRVEHDFVRTTTRPKFDASKLFLPSKPFLRPHYIKGKS